MGMTGNQDRTERAQARLEQIYERLDPMLDKAMETLDGIQLKPGDALSVQRYVRGVELVARAARAVATLATPPRSPGGRQQQEDEMDHRDDSPETLERLRAELEARFGVLDALLEKKGLVVEPGCWPTARPGGEPVHAA